ncbi:MAG: cysteine desulfurase [Clostridiales bacterium]|nr:cysteine desulfurase [Clostridiales bacterium]
MSEIYFDNCASTKVSAGAAGAALAAMRDDYGNASSLHALGARAAALLTDCRAAVARLLDAEPAAIHFTSGGTEANNQAVLGLAAAGAARGRTVLLSAVEHPSVLEPGKALAGQGFNVKTVPVDGDGRVDLEALAGMLDGDVTLLSVQHVNNETGVVQPLEQIGRLLSGKNIFFHVDGAQSFGKLPLRLSALPADAFSASGHKIHAPKGCGFLYLRPGLRVPPLLLGGGQEGGRRSGTENMPAIAALARAAREVSDDLQSRMETCAAVKETLRRRLLELLPDCRVNTPLQGSAPHILNVSFPGVKSEVLLHHLEREGIYVSSGSACSSNKKQPSHVLLAMGLPAALADSAIRFSFCHENTVGEAERAALATAAAVREIRLLSGGGKKRRG